MPIHNDGLLLLDETKRASGDLRQRATVVTETIMKLAEHTGKERLTNVSSPRSWRGYFLATSNYSLNRLCQLGKRVIDDAEHGRMADIPVPSGKHGVFEQLHGFNSGQDLADELQRRSRKYCGSAGREFLRKLVRERRRDEKDLRKQLNADRKAYLKELTAKLSPTDRKPLNRVTGRYANTFSAGCLAIRFGILPWKREELLEAILSCQMDALRFDDPADKQDHSIESLRECLTGWLDQNHKNFKPIRHRKLRKGRNNINDFVGFHAKHKGRDWFYLTRNRLETIIGTGQKANLLIRSLQQEGLMDPGKRRNVVQRALFRGGLGTENYVWVYAISPDILKHR